MISPLKRRGVPDGLSASGSENGVHHSVTVRPSTPKEMVVPGYQNPFVIGRGSGDPGQQSLRSHPPTERSRCWCQAGTKPLAGIHAFALASIAWIIPRADNSSNVPANRRKAIPPSLFDSDASKQETNRSTRSCISGVSLSTRAASSAGMSIASASPHRIRHWTQYALSRMRWPGARIGYSLG
jgi:hypothetical protein